MTRIVKDPAVRRSEIMAAADELFKIHGYNNTTIDAIIQKAGIAKGTFYYYFKSKEDILDVLVKEMVEHVSENYKMVAARNDINALDKIKTMLRGQNQLADQEIELFMNLHQAENRELHERMNVETILRISPVISEVIEQGIAESLFQVESPLETIQFLLSGSFFLLESNLFQWNAEEKDKRMQSMQKIIERSLGASPGSFSFL